MSAHISRSDEAAGAVALEHRHRTVAFWLGLMTLSMIGASFAAVPLYQLFCKTTGYGGATIRAAAPSAVALDRSITIRFDANTRNLPWTFGPVQLTQDVRIGENALAFYRAENTSGHTVKGTAAFNVTPEIAGAYFYKIECFCFKEQTLAPGQSIEMPVSFYVDPAIMTDPDARRLSEITLSYTFYPSGDQARENPLAEGAGGTVKKGG